VKLNVSQMSYVPEGVAGNMNEWSLKESEWF
jgi:hypothetical protein